MDGFYCRSVLLSISEAISDEVEAYSDVITIVAFLLSVKNSARLCLSKLSDDTASQESPMTSCAKR